MGAGDAHEDSDEKQHEPTTDDLTSTERPGSPNSSMTIDPIRWKTEQPERDANFLAIISFWWLQPLFSRAAFLKKHGLVLQQEDLAPLMACDHSSDIVQGRFEQGWKEYQPSKKKAKPTKGESTEDEEDAELQLRLRHALWQVIGRRFIIAGIIKFFNTLLQFSFPLLLNAILKFFEDTENGTINDDSSPAKRYQGYWLSGLLLIAVALKAITESNYFHRINRCGWSCKAAISAAVYGKSLRLASAALHGTTLGEMVNLMQVDALKIEAFMPQAHVVWDGLLQIAGYVTILGTLLGWPCITGLFVMMCATPVLGTVMQKLFGQNRAMVKFTDERVKSTNEALQGIRSVKMYTWEGSFAKQIGKSREQELACLKKVAYLRAFSRAYMSALPTVAAVCTFLVYTYVTDGEIAASTLFASLVAFDQLRFPLLFYPISLASLVQAKVSLSRVSKYLGLTEISSEGYNRVTEGDGEVEIQNATVYWSDPKVPVPKPKPEGDIDLSMSESTRSRRSQSSAKSSSPSSTELDRTESEEGLVYPKPVVKNVSLKVSPGELCAIVGRVGSGKSSLCSAILNETCLEEGSEITVRGRKVAYCSQSAWILNKTIRENILFGMPFDEEKYNKVIDVCQLQHDLEMLEDGDATEIGEQGINLSGGQKQRVALARAAYAEADLIIFDDPLSALDPEVAGKAFEECILGFLNGKSRILVTNQLQCLSKCDTVVAMGKGKVIEQGTFSDLMNDTNGEVQRILKDLETKAEKDTEAKDAAKEKTSGFSDEGDGSGQASPPGATAGAGKDPKDAKNLITKEEREVGAVKAGVYLKYMKAGGGFVPFSWVYVMYILSAAVTLLATAWVSIWTSDPMYERNSKSFYMGYYSLTAVLLGVFTFMRSYLLTKFGVKASFNLHEKLMDSVLHAKMSFFDTTPTGRILTRFSSDLFSVDQELADFLDIFLFLTLNVLVTMGAIVFVTPWFGIALVPLAYVYLRVLNYFRQVSRETKRLESLSRSPVYSHFSETLGGLSTIRAFDFSDKFVGQFETLLDESTRASYNNKAADRWLSSRLEMIGAFVAGLASMFATQVVISGSSSGDTDDFASLAGLSLTYAIGITGALQFVVRTLAQVEAAMNACERVFYYSESIPREAPSTANDLEKLVAATEGPDSDDPPPSSVAVIAAGGKAEHPSTEWPSKGEITLTQLLMRYREETPLVLKGLNVNIGAGKRIGVVGRTGSGKSSLLLCLLRIVEPEVKSDATEYQPPIMIDGVDILRIGLHELRSKVGIIPQSPVLFSGTIRSNLDPFDEYTDEQIYEALQKCGMYEAVIAMDGEIFAPVSEYGENLSQGQRQLLCLGRALLRNCKVLLLDEATSSVDFETDREIQRTLREAFAGCTVLTIAHRVNTITDSDYILVMKDGVAGEFGPPDELLKDENSLFADIVRHTRAEEGSNP